MYCWHCQENYDDLCTICPNCFAELRPGQLVTKESSISQSFNKLDNIAHTAELVSSSSLEELSFPQTTLSHCSSESAFGLTEGFEACSAQDSANTLGLSSHLSMASALEAAGALSSAGSLEMPEPLSSTGQLEMSDPFISANLLEMPEAPKAVASQASSSELSLESVLNLAYDGSGSGENESAKAIVGPATETWRGGSAKPTSVVRYSKQERKAKVRAAQERYAQQQINQSAGSDGEAFMQRLLKRTDADGGTVNNELPESLSFWKDSVKAEQDLQKISIGSGQGFPALFKFLFCLALAFVWPGAGSFVMGVRKFGTTLAVAWGYTMVRYFNDSLGFCFFIYCLLAISDFICVIMVNKQASESTTK